VKNELVVKVDDPDRMPAPNPHGKQTLHPHGGFFYTSTSGIWQTVWLEIVPRTYIESLTMTPDMDRSQLHLQVNLKGEEEGYIPYRRRAKKGSAIVARQTVNGTTALHLSHLHLWSPDDPFFVRP